MKIASESSNSSYSLQNFEKNVILLILECGHIESFIKKQMLKEECSCNPLKSLVHFEKLTVD